MSKTSSVDPPTGTLPNMKIGGTEKNGSREFTPVPPTSRMVTPSRDGSLLSMTNRSPMEPTPAGVNRIWSSSLSPGAMVRGNSVGATSSYERPFQGYMAGPSSLSMTRSEPPTLLSGMVIVELVPPRSVPPGKGPGYPGPRSRSGSPAGLSSHRTW